MKLLSTTLSLCILCAAATATDHKGQPLAKLTLAVPGNEKNATLVFNGTDLWIPQHTDQIAANVESIKALQGELDELFEGQKAINQTIKQLDTEVGGLGAIWAEDIAESIDALDIPALKLLAKQANTTATKALAVGKAAKAAARDNANTSVLLLENVGINARAIDSVRKMVGENTDEIDEIQAGHACKKGYWRDAANPDHCKACPAGKFSTIVGADECIGDGCQPGEFNEQIAAFTEDMAKCKLCIAGTWTGDYEQTECQGKPCKAGEWHFRGMKVKHECEECHAGRYTNETGHWLEDGWPHHKACFACPGGTASAKRAAISIKACAECKLGTYATAGSAECTACAYGKYSTEPRADDESDCDNCKDGEYTKYEGATGCLDCEAGKYYFGEEPNPKPSCNDCTDTGKCNDKFVKFNDESCTPTTDQKCVKKWSEQNNKQCSGTTVGTSNNQCNVDSAKAACEKRSTCNGVSYSTYDAVTAHSCSSGWHLSGSRCKQNYRHQVCHPRCWGWWGCWGWSCYYRTSTRYKDATKKYSTHSVCKVCNRNTNPTYKTGAKFYDYGMW